jgi:hypothetical protein
MQKSKLITQIIFASALAISAASVTKAVAQKAAGQDEPGECGEYTYWKNGHCVDARNSPPKAWSETMTSRPVW